jgi:thioredoxin 1
MSVNTTESSFLNDVSKGLVLVDFWAEWCGPCRMLTPTLNKIEAEMEGRLTVVKVNVDEEPQLARDYQVMSIPTMILFQDGAPIKTVVGVKPKKQLLEEFEGFL